MQRSRNSLNDWAYGHFKGLEETINQSEEARRKLGLVIHEREAEILQLKERLHDAGDGVTTTKQVDERDAEIAQLKQQLQDTRNQFDMTKVDGRDREISRLRQLLDDTQNQVATLAAVEEGRLRA